MLLLCFSACTHLPSPQERADKALHLADQAGWQPEDITTDNFTLRAFLPSGKKKSKILTIYVEGDGLAWINSSTPSHDPTPIDPLALQLALRDADASVYLARPCQFVGGRNCSQKYWGSHRFSVEVIYAFNQAVGQLKQQFGAESLILVGYSGGGAVAALVAALRSDVSRLVTVAGNLDHKAWTVEHHLSPLSGSLNPAEMASQLMNIPQIHFVGDRDRTIGESVVRAYASKFPIGAPLEVVVLPGFDHHCCWVEGWPVLKERAFNSSSHILILK